MRVTSYPSYLLSDIYCLNSKPNILLQTISELKENGDDITTICYDRLTLNYNRRPYRWKKKKRYCEIRTSSSRIVDRGSYIDAYARVLFPCAFGVFNMLYWTLYLYTIDDEIPDDIEQWEDWIHTLLDDNNQKAKSSFLSLNWNVDDGQQIVK